MYKLRIRILAKEDANEIFEYYDKIETSLGVSFLYALYSEFDAIILNPHMFQWVRFLKKFPYGLHYRIVEDKYIEILSVLHTSRNPEIWKKRNG